MSKLTANPPLPEQRLAMSTVSKSSIEPMEGSGFYNRHSLLQAAGITAVIPLWRKVVHSVEVGEENLVIADYGSSQGHNSMLPIRIAIEAFRKPAGASRPIEVIHTDLPSNDFASLFRVLEEDSDSYLASAPNVFFSAIGRSYFEPILPPRRVHLGWNSWTLHWMSRKPADAPDHVFAGLDSSQEVRAAVEEQKAQDWRRFLLARASELAPKGKLLSLFAGKPEDKNGWTWLGDELWNSIRDMGRDGLLSEEEQLHMTLPTAQRSLAEIHAPFANGGVFAGLKIEHAEIIQGPDPFWTEFQEKGDAEHLGQAWGNMMRAVFAPTIASAIDDERNRGALVDDLFARFAVRLAAAPQKNEHYFAVVVLSKSDN